MVTHQFSSLSRVPRSPVFPLGALKDKVGESRGTNKEPLHAPAPSPPHQGELTYGGTLWPRESRGPLQAWEALKWNQKSLLTPLARLSSAPHDDKS